MVEQGKNIIAKTYLVNIMGGISNFQIENAFKKINDEDLLNNFVGVFPANYMNKFIKHATMINDSGKFQFVIANTDDSSKSGTHWWNIFDIEPRNDIFFFDSCKIEALKHFIIQDDKKIVDKILIGIDKMDRSDKKITLCKIKFNLGACKQLSEDEVLSLSGTARNFFCFVQAFRNKLKLRSFLNIWMVEDRLQDLDSSTCSIFQMFLYQNLFNPPENSKIQGETKLNKKTVETLLNEIFTLDDKENKIKMEEYANSLDIKIM